MPLFNYIGAIFIVIIMIPNIIYAVKHRGRANGGSQNKAVDILEQIGRYGCILFMVLNIPYLYFNFWFDGAIIAYIALGCAICVAYCDCWIVFRKKDGKAKAVTLSVLPSCLFLFGGLMLLNIPLIVFSLVFAACHILKCRETEKQPDRQEQ